MPSRQVFQEPISPQKTVPLADQMIGFSIVESVKFTGAVRVVATTVLPVQPGLPF